MRKLVPGLALSLLAYAGLACAGLAFAGLACAGLAFAGLACAGLAFAQSEPIRILTTYPATGSSSTATTIIAPKLQEFLGREVVIDYGVGPQAGVAAPADERTIFVSTIGNMAMLPAILASFGVDPLADLRPVTRLGDAAERYGMQVD